jgi:hypothetical protein
MQNSCDRKRAIYISCRHHRKSYTVKKVIDFPVLSRDVANLFYNVAEDAEGSETGVNMIQLADFLQLYNSRIFTQDFVFLPLKLLSF